MRIDLRKIAACVKDVAVDRQRSDRAIGLPEHRHVRAGEFNDPVLPWKRDGESREQLIATRNQSTDVTIIGGWEGVIESRPLGAVPPDQAANVEIAEPRKTAADKDIRPAGGERGLVIAAN